MTDVFEGSLIRVFRRLQELIRQMSMGAFAVSLLSLHPYRSLTLFLICSTETAAKAIGSEELEKKFLDSLACLERQSSVAFAASLVRSLLSPFKRPVADDTFLDLAVPLSGLLLLLVCSVIPCSCTVVIPRSRTAREEVCEGQRERSCFFIQATLSPTRSSHHFFELFNHASNDSTPGCSSLTFARSTL